MKALLAACALLGLTGCVTTPEEDPVEMRLADLDARVGRIDRIVSNQSLVQMARCPCVSTRQYPSAKVIFIRSPSRRAATRIASTCAARWLFPSPVRLRLSPRAYRRLRTAP